MEKLPQTSIHRLKPEKDDSDTQSAVNLAISQGAKDILILGGTGTRLDHVMANLGLLLSGKERGVNIRIADVNNFITLVDNGTVLHKDRQYGKYVSFFSVGGDVTGLPWKALNIRCMIIICSSPKAGLLSAMRLRSRRLGSLFQGAIC